MPSDVSFERRLRYQDMAIARLMCEAQILRDENAGLRARLEAAPRTRPGDANGDRLEASLPAGPGAPATARAALTRWLTGHVPRELLADARLLTSELVASSVGAAASEEDSLRLAVELRAGALRVDVSGSPGRDAGRALGGGFGLQLIEALATRWGVDHAGGMHF